MPLTFSLSTADKPSPKILIPFLTLHGLLFLGIEYILFPTFPLFMLVHALLGIAIYLIFWRAGFPHLFRDVFIGAVISVVIGFLFGDFLLDKFFFLHEEAPQGFVPKMYSAVVVFYVYFYLILIRKFLFQNKKTA